MDGDGGRLTIAVLGSGSIGLRHLNVIRSSANVQPIAIPLRAERRIELIHMGYKVAESLKMATGQGVSLAIIATDTHRHLMDSQEALRLGFSLLVEKPLAINAVQANDLMRDVAETKRTLAVGCALRFSQTLNNFRALLPRLGHIHSVRIECQSYLPDWRPKRPYRDSYSARPNEGGVLRDLIHEIDYAGWLFGWPKLVQSRVRNLRRLGIESDESADLFWETEAGTIVSIRLDYLSRPTRRYMRACGEFGTLEWDAVTNKTIFSTAEGETQENISDQSRDQMLADQLRAFVATSEGRIDALLATAKDGGLALAVCDAARQSSETRKEVEVNYYGLT